MSKKQKEEEEVHLESTTEHHPCNADSAAKPQTSTKQVGDVSHKPKQEAKSVLRKGPNKRSLPHTDHSIVPPQNRTASTGKAVPQRRETRSTQQAILPAKKSNKMAVASKKSSVKEMNPLPSIANTEDVQTNHDLDNHTEGADVQGSDQDELYDGSTSLSDVIEEVVIQGPELEETTVSQTSEEKDDAGGGVDDCVMWERTHKELAQRAEEVVSKMLGQPGADSSGRGRTGSIGAGVRRWEETSGWPQDHEGARMERKKARKKVVSFQMVSPHKEVSGGGGRTQVASPSEQLEGKVRTPPVVLAWMLG